MAQDTMAQRYDKLLPHILVYGPADSLPRPAMVLFHGCGGIAPNLMHYAELCKTIGIRAFIIDSYAARGWSRKQGATLVCTGLRLRGHERSGDVLAALWGLSQRPDVDPNQLILAGWSHGAWAIMDLMTQALDRPSEARLANPDARLMDSVKGLFLAYPYIGFPARSTSRPWLYRPRVLTVLALKDHLVRYHQSLSFINRLRGQGLEVKTLTLDATHAFDEPGIDKTKIMRFDAEGLQSTLEALRAWLRDGVKALD
jgi:dienelactone hydrolase